MVELDEFITAHLHWRSRLLEKIEVGDFDFDAVSRDDICEIGKWIHGPGQETYKSLPEFSNLVKAHANFHIAVASSLSKTGITGSDAEFEFFIRSLKKLSETIWFKKRQDRCSIILEGVERHLNNNSLELAKVVAGTFPCQSCNLSNECTILEQIHSQFRAINMQ